MLGPAVRSLQRLRRATLWAGVALSLGTLAALIGPAWVGRQEAIEEARTRGALLAQVLEADASRTIETASLSLHALGDGLARGVDASGHRDEEEHLGEHFNHVLVGLPFIRGVALLDARGRVLTSTDAEDVGLEIPLDDFGRLPGPDRDLLLPLRPGRGLADLARGRQPRGATAVSMLPMLLQLPAPPDAPALAASSATGPVPGDRERDPRWLLALINPDALAQVQQRALPAGRSAAWLASTDGQLLAAMETLHQLPGQRLDGHPAFDALRRGREHGTYLGTGALPGELVVAFRASSRRPLIVGVEQSLDEVLAAWHSGLRWLLLIGTVALALIAAATATVRRSLQARAETMEALEGAHEQLADRERDMRVLLKSVQEVIFRTNPAGTLTFVNARWTTLHRGRPDEAVGRRLADLAEPADREAVAALFDADDGVRGVEATIRNGEGAPRRYQIAVVPLRRDGALLGYAGSAVDITERSAAERLTRQARDAAEEASRIKTEFLANISHELRTPLQSILGFSELGIARSGEQERLRAMFADIHGSGQRMLTLVNDLLDAAKLESNVGALDLRPVDLREPVGAVLRELAPLTAKRQLALIADLPDALPGRADPLRLQQAVRNVLANAIKFAPQGGTIELRGRRDADGGLHLSVADRGPGIPAQELERIFDPFIQSSATKDGSGGTGLGLPISRRIVELHGGRLYATNREGGGAEFHLVLPPCDASDLSLTDSPGVQDEVGRPARE
ncbi:MAG: PAS domain-containing protein [Mitsuaria chitosanitabida]|uniref:ATP-binding protein n=1 Tax=Roseateles chitosanitabidus TaxID=65048 RepID=UPI001B190CB1|nr:ATP-binding protein [Roseateles chitosanitabidus]MBO9687697.1 PAS domain-containing protein [Roseateles chitosanitabidus]